MLQQTYHVAGTLAANLNIRFTAHNNMQLKHVSAVASNDSDATMTLGTSADADGFLAACVIGDSGTPVEKGLADFDGALLSDPGGELPRISDGDVVVIGLDFDGAAGTAAANVTIVLTLLEG